MIALVVEDDVVTGSGLVNFLRSRGWRAEWAADGFSATAKLSVMAPDVVILDMCLPDVNGRELLRALLGTVPRVVVLTGLPNGVPETIAADFPGLEVVQKPIAPEELLDRLENKPARPA